MANSLPPSRLDTQSSAMSPALTPFFTAYTSQATIDHPNNFSAASAMVDSPVTQGAAVSPVNAGIYQYDLGAAEDDVSGLSAVSPSTMSSARVYATPNRSPSRLSLARASPQQQQLSRAMSVLDTTLSPNPSECRQRQLGDALSKRTRESPSSTPTPRPGSAASSSIAPRRLHSTQAMVPAGRCSNDGVSSGAIPRHTSRSFESLDCASPRLFVSYLSNSLSSGTARTPASYHNSDFVSGNDAADTHARSSLNVATVGPLPSGGGSTGEATSSSHGSRSSLRLSMQHYHEKGPNRRSDPDGDNCILYATATYSSDATTQGPMGAPKTAPVAAAAQTATTAPYESPTYFGLQNFPSMSSTPAFTIAASSIPIEKARMKRKASLSWQQQPANNSEVPRGGDKKAERAAATGSGNEKLVSPSNTQSPKTPQDAEQCNGFAHRSPLLSPSGCSDDNGTSYTKEELETFSSLRPLPSALVSPTNRDPAAALHAVSPSPTLIISDHSGTTMRSSSVTRSAVSAPQKTSGVPLSASSRGDRKGRGSEECPWNLPPQMRRRTASAAIGSTVTPAADYKKQQRHTRRQLRQHDVSALSAFSVRKLAFNISTDGNKAASIKAPLSMVVPVEGHRCDTNANESSQLSEPISNSNTSSSQNSNVQAKRSRIPCAFQLNLRPLQPASPTKQQKVRPVDAQQRLCPVALPPLANPSPLATEFTHSPASRVTDENNENSASSIMNVGANINSMSNSRLSVSPLSEKTRRSRSAIDAHVPPSIANAAPKALRVPTKPGDGPVMSASHFTRCFAVRGTPPRGGAPQVGLTTAVTSAAPATSTDGESRMSIPTAATEPPANSRLTTNSSASDPAFNCETMTSPLLSPSTPSYPRRWSFQMQRSMDTSAPLLPPKLEVPCAAENSAGGHPPVSQSPGMPSFHTKAQNVVASTSADTPNSARCTAFKASPCNDMKAVSTKRRLKSRALVRSQKHHEEAVVSKTEHVADAGATPASRASQPDTAKSPLLVLGKTVRTAARAARRRPSRPHRPSYPTIASLSLVTVGTHSSSVGVASVETACTTSATLSSANTMKSAPSALTQQQSSSTQYERSTPQVMGEEGEERKSGSAPVTALESPINMVRRASSPVATNHSNEKQQRANVATSLEVAVCRPPPLSKQHDSGALLSQSPKAEANKIPGEAPPPPLDVCGTRVFNSLNLLDGNRSSTRTMPYAITSAHPPRSSTSLPESDVASLVAISGKQDESGKAPADASHAQPEVVVEAANASTTMTTSMEPQKHMAMVVPEGNYAHRRYSSDAPLTPEQTQTAEEMVAPSLNLADNRHNGDDVTLAPPAPSLTPTERQGKQCTSFFSVAVPLTSAEKERSASDGNSSTAVAAAAGVSDGLPTAHVSRTAIITNDHTTTKQQHLLPAEEQNTKQNAAAANEIMEPPTVCTSIAKKQHVSSPSRKDAKLSGFGPSTSSLDAQRSVTKHVDQKATEEAALQTLSRSSPSAATANAASTAITPLDALAASTNSLHHAPLPQQPQSPTTTTPAATVCYHRSALYSFFASAQPSGAGLSPPAAAAAAAAATAGAPLFHSQVRRSPARSGVAVSTPTSEPPLLPIMDQSEIGQLWMEVRASALKNVDRHRHARRSSRQRQRPLSPHAAASLPVGSNMNRSNNNSSPDRTGQRRLQRMSPLWPARRSSSPADLTTTTVAASAGLGRTSRAESFDPTSSSSVTTGGNNFSRDCAHLSLPSVAITLNSDDDDELHEGRHTHDKWAFLEYDPDMEEVLRAKAEVMRRTGRRPSALKLPTRRVGAHFTGEVGEGIVKPSLQSTSSFAHKRRDRWSLSFNPRQGCDMASVKAPTTSTTLREYSTAVSQLRRAQPSANNSGGEDGHVEEALRRYPCHSPMLSLQSALLLSTDGGSESDDSVDTVTSHSRAAGGGNTTANRNLWSSNVSGSSSVSPEGARDRAGQQMGSSIMRSGMRLRNSGLPLSAHFSLSSIHNQSSGSYAKDERAETGGAPISNSTAPVAVHCVDLVGKDAHGAKQQEQPPQQSWRSQLQQRRPCARPSILLFGTDDDNNGSISTKSDFLRNDEDEEKAAPGATCGDGGSASLSGASSRVPRSSRQRKASVSEPEDGGISPVLSLFVQMKNQPTSLVVDALRPPDVAATATPTTATVTRLSQSNTKTTTNSLVSGHNTAVTSPFPPSSRQRVFEARIAALSGASRKSSGSTQPARGPPTSVSDEDGNSGVTAQAPVVAAGAARMTDRAKVANVKGYPVTPPIDIAQHETFSNTSFVYHPLTLDELAAHNAMLPVGNTVSRSVFTIRSGFNSVLTSSTDTQFGEVSASAQEEQLAVTATELPQHLISKRALTEPLCNADSGRGKQLEGQPSGTSVTTAVAALGGIPCGLPVVLAAGTGVATVSVKGAPATLALPGAMSPSGNSNDHFRSRSDKRQVNSRLPVVKKERGQDSDSNEKGGKRSVSGSSSLEVGECASTRGGVTPRS
ncbi:hypothetical protein ABL78_0216 [Leptomonas seymouri]|uniref:Uncharacterized protein n=1 Tax=Leptomonas seymouri TaxID=5684 RepID=A0A0N1PFE1_LEPSE|nr:hypothetical protein ABL78_0216 [Leptomonas seymouri]|eukprot:KPI90620.1 hypothetical protein ABL78_0216 [Leptomonas seymouri]